MIALGVLDQSPVPSGSTPAAALGTTVALARAAERLGYRRYWLAEHHNTGSLASTAPEVLTGHIAAATSSIRVGAGGVLLPYYSPLKVAEVFRTLHALFPGRIDLGVGRAAGADDVAAAALRRGGVAVADEDHLGQVAELLGFLHARTAPGHPFAGVRALPSGAGAPGLWILGSSSDSAALAAALGLSYSYAHFISPSYGAQVVASYRDRFRPSPASPAPRVSVGVSVICADTDARAERLALSDDVWRLRPEGAERGPLPSVEEAEAYSATELEHLLMAQNARGRVVGAPDRARDALLRLAQDYGAGELMVLTVCHDSGARIRSYELLAEAFDLQARE